MPNENEEVKEFNEEKIMEPTPLQEGDEIIEPVTEKETPAESSEEEKPEPEPEAEAEAEVEEPEAEEVPAEVSEPKPVVGETPREKALRLEATRLKGLLRKERQDDLFVKQPVTKNSEVDLDGYDPDEIKRFKEVAEKLGFARKDDIQSQTTQDKLNTEFDTFMEAHPEYLPENDKDGVLWNNLKSEFNLYNAPQDVKTFRKILNKVHNEIHGVQPAMNLNKINAQQQKLKVASHTGTQGSRASVDSPKAPNSNIRLDMLKGYTEEELKELES